MASDMSRSASRAAMRVSAWPIDAAISRRKPR